MLYALDKNNNKIKPTKGVEAKCQYCFEKVIAACGQINIHHWRHEADSNCDPWKEHETEWHRQWKEKFPENWREIIIIEDYEKHIADVQTETGLVLELQNSSISSTTIQIRENFYGKMVWLINAEPFKKNLSTDNLVKSRLRELNSYHEYYLSEGNQIEESLESYYKKLKKIDKSFTSIDSQLNSNLRQIEECQNFKGELDKTVNRLVNSYIHFFAFNDFKSDQIVIIKGLNNSIDDIDDKNKQLNARLKNIYNFPNSKLSGYTTFREIGFDKVSSSHYSICKVIKRDTLNSFFPEVLDIRSEIEFDRYSYKKDKYLLIINLTDNTKSILDEISVLEKNKESIILDRESKLNILKNEVSFWLDELILTNQKNIDNQKSEIIDLKQKKEELLIEIEGERKWLIKESIEQNKKHKAEKKSKEIKIMQTLKGHYSYTWKYRRKTWDFANCTLFLDYGTHIFQIISEDQLIKLTTEDFINRIKNWQC
jgi:hypothetical protein